MRKTVQADTPQKRKKPYTVLVIEPDEAYAERIRRSFSRRKKTFGLTFARTLEEAREVLSTATPALIIAAWELPDGRGIEILPKKDGHPTLPLVILAGHGNEKDGLAALKSGAVDYVAMSDMSLEGLPFIAARALLSWDSTQEREAAIRTARDADTKFRLLVESSGVGIAYYDFEGTTLFYSRAAAAIMGGTPEDFTGKPVHDLFDRALAETILRRIGRVKDAPDQPGIYEDEVVLPTGRRWFHSTYAPVWDETGKLHGVQVVSHDITERKDAERDAEEVRKHLADILDFLPDATFAIDTQGRVIAWNRAIEAMTGVPAEEMIGRGDYEYSIPFYGERRPILIDLVLESRDDIEKKYLYVRREGERITSETYIPGLFKGRGAHLWGTASPLYDRHGNPAGAVEVIRDITDRKENERALTKSGMLLNQTQQLTHVGGWEYDIPSGTVTWTDEVYRIYDVPHEYDPSNIKEDLAFYPPDDQRIIGDAFRRAVNEGVPYDLELKFVSAKGVEKWVKTIGQADCAGGKPVRLFGYIIDITDRKNAEIRIVELLGSLRNEKERLAILLNSITDEVWFADTNHRFTLANPRAVEEFQLSGSVSPNVEELAGSLEVLRPDGTPRPVGEAPPLRALNGEVIRNMEEIIRTPATGELRYRQVSSTPVRDAAGAIIGSVSVVRDITDQKRTEAQIREANERFEIVSKATNDTVWDWDLLTGSQWWNEGIQTVFGYRPEEIEPTVASWNTRIHPDDRERVIDGIHAAINSGENTWSDEYHFRRADGSYAFVFDRGFVIRDGEGRAVRMIGAMQDLTERMEMVGTLRESEDRFRSIVETSPNMIWELDTQGKFCYMSPAVTDILGYAPEEIIGRHVTDLVPENRRAQAEEILFGMVSEEGSLSPVEVPARHRDGRDLVLEIRPARLLGTGGELKGLRGVAADITERKRAEATLQESEDRFRNLFTNIHAGVSIYHAENAGEDFVFREINPAVERIENVRRADVIGRSVLEVFPGVKEFGLFEVFQRVWRTGIPEQHPVSEYRDGRITGWRENSVFRLPSGEVVSIYEDVTGKKQAEEALRVSEERYRTLTEGIPDIIARFDREHRHLFINRAIESLTGRPADSFIGRTNQDLGMPGELNTIWDEKLDHVFDSGSMVTFEFAYPAGENLVFFESRIIPEFSPSGTVLSAISVARDITAEVRAEQEHRKSESRLDDAMEIGNLAWWEMDLPEGLVRFDSRKATMLGFSPDAFHRYSDFTSLLHPDDYEPTMQAMRDHLDGRDEKYNADYRIRTAGGEYRWFRDIGGITRRNSDGTPATVTGIIIDITAAKEAEEALQRSERLLNETQQLAKVGGWEFDVVTGKGRWTDEVFEIYGLPRGATPDITESVSFYSPDDQARIASAFKNAIERGIPYDLTLRFTSRDGKEKWLRTTAQADCTGGSVVRVYGNILDVTDMKKAQDALAESERKFRTVADFTYDWEYWTGTDGEYIYISPSCERISGYAPADFYNNKDLILQIVVPEDREVVLEHRRGMTGSTDPQVVEFRITRKDGRIIWVGHMCQPIFSSEGKFLGRRGSNRDITTRKIAEDALRESETRFRALIQNSSDIIRILDSEGRITYESASAGRLLGYPTGSMIGRDPLEFIHPDDRERVLSDLREVYENVNTGMPTEFRIRKADGEYLWVDAIGVNLLDVPGVEGIVITTRPIQQRKLMEDELKENQLRLAEAMEMAQLVNWEMDVPTGTYTFNDRFYTLYGTNAEREGGYRMPAETYVKEFVHPDDVPDFTRAMAEVASVTDPGYSRVLEHRIMRRDGQVRHIIVRFGVVMDDAGRLAKILGANQDITDRKLMESEIRTLNRVLEQRVIERTLDLEQSNKALFDEIGQRKAAEERLHETNEYLNNLFDYANAPIIVWDPQFRITRFNHAFEWLTGCLSADVTGKHVSVLFPGQSREQSMAFIRQAMTGERWETVEIPILRRDGTERIVLWNSATLLAGDGKTVVATIAQGQDITERKNAEERLRTSLDEKLTLLKEVHHRVKNNLQIIISLLNLQARNITDEGTLAAIRESQNRVRAMALVHEKLYQTENLSQINLDEYLTYMGKNLFQFYGAGSRGITFSTDTGDIHLEINTAIPFGLIMNELISNSLKYAFPGKRGGGISVRVKREGQTLFVEYRDDGVGIPGSIDWQNTRSLGLRLVNSLVRQLNGHIELDRSAGTAFSMVLHEKA